MGERRKKRDASKEWKQRHFLLLSLVVTTLSISFFFAGRHIFHKIIDKGYSPSTWALSRVAELGGFVIKSVDLEIQPYENHSGAEEFSDFLKRKALSYEGQPIWTVSLDSIREDIEQLAWAKSVSVTRRLPRSLKISVEPRSPSFVLRAPNSWIVCDKNGVFLFASQSFQGTWSEMPVVTGLEERLRGGIRELNRSLKKEQFWLKDLGLLVDALETQVSLQVETVDIRWDPWLEQPVFRVKTFDRQKRLREIEFLSENWRSRLSSFQYVLSVLDEDNLEGALVLGQYSDRIIVRDYKSSAQTENVEKRLQ